MKEVKVTLPERLLKRIDELGREPSEVIIEALNRAFDPSYSVFDLTSWQSHIDKKLSDLQVQFDEHRKSCTKDTAKDFDDGYIKRSSGKQKVIDVDEPESDTRSLVEEVQTETKRKKKASTLEEVDVELDF